MNTFAILKSIVFVYQVYFGEFNNCFHGKNSPNIVHTVNVLIISGSNNCMFKSINTIFKDVSIIGTCWSNFLKTFT